MPTKIVVACMSRWYGASGFLGIVVGHVLLNLPFAFYQFYLGYLTIDGAFELTAINLGASRLHYYRTIVLPLLLPTILETTALIFFLCFTAVSIPLLLGTNIYHATPDVMLYKNSGSMAETFFYGFCRIAIALPLIIMQLRAIAPVQIPQLTIISAPAKKNKWLWGYSVVMVCALVTPLSIFVWHALNKNVLFFWRSIINGAIEPILSYVRLSEVVTNSLLLAAVSACGALVVGFLLCITEQKTKSRGIRFLIIILAYMPIMLGGVLTNVVLIWATGTHVVTQQLSAIFCHVLVNYPFAYCIVKAQMAVCSDELYFLAQSLGASPFTFFKTVELPLLRAALGRAWCVAFGLSLTEVVGTGSNFLTIPCAVHAYRTAGRVDETVGMSLILLVLAVIATSSVQIVGYVNSGFKIRWRWHKDVRTSLLQRIGRKIF